MKKCRKCENTLPKSEFYADKRSSDGLKSQCKKCHIANCIKTRDKENTRRINKEYMRRAVDKDPEKFRKRWREYDREQNIKTNARKILNNALKAGKIIKPSNCSECDKEVKLTAHHEDYTKPLEVIWLCYECHGKKNRKD